MAGSSKQFSSFGDVLDRMRLPKQVKDHIKNHEIWSKWAEIVGHELSRLTFPVELKSKCLEVMVAHQAWAQQLQFLKPSILGKIRNLCPAAAVNDLHFRVGKIQAPRNQEQERFQRQIQTRPARLTERQEVTLRAVEDPELRSAIRRAMEAASKRMV